ncbi:MAG: aldehyde reductase [Anaerolineales bacterium]|nr:aldehyde reductase [Anaerolineales bacterium]
MENSSRTTTVAVTGATGFIASRCVIDLLNQGYLVKGTVRDLELGKELKAWLAPHTSRVENLTLYQANLLSEDGWDQAFTGCRYVLHLASPFPLLSPENENELIRPAVEGTRQVLEAALRNQVQRVVMTSSTAAVSYGHQDQDRVFTHKDWSDLNGSIEPYQKSKTLAEKTAWEFIRSLPEGYFMELAVVNPGYVLGPVINHRAPTSISLHQMLMQGSLPGVARIKFNLVDVRDVSKVHLAAMTSEMAVGKRFLCVGGGIWLGEVAEILSNHFRPQGYRIPRIQFPDWFVRLYSLVDKRARLVVKSVGKDTAYDISQTQEVLEWNPIPLKQTIIEMGESLIEFGLINRK